MWDILRSRSARRIVEQGCLYSEILPPALKGDDPVFKKLGIYPSFNIARSEYLYRVRGKILIEPEFGYVIIKPFTIIDLALPGSELTRQKTGRQFFSGVPSIIKVAHAKPIKRVPSIITFRYVFDGNYYHFYQDIMAKLKLLEDHNIDKALPILVSSALASKSYFQTVTQRGSLAKRKWIVQEDFFIEAEEVIFAKVEQGTRDRLDYFLDSFDAVKADSTKFRRLFLTRGQKHGRYIVNMDQIKPILEKYHFEVIDTGEMTFDEQITVFSQARYVIGIHGAGLTNIIYRRGERLSLLEIFQPDETPLHYYAISKIYSFNYDYIVGTDRLNKTRTAPFSVDPLVFGEKVNMMFANHADLHN